MHHTFKGMKKDSYFCHVNDSTHTIYKKKGTYTFVEVESEETYDIRETLWHDCYDSEFGMFRLAKVEIQVNLIGWL